MDKIKPNLFISRCIEQEACRWNAAVISSAEIKKLLPYINVINACPEADIGLGIPRDPIRILMQNEQKRLIQPSTNLDLTDKMLSFCDLTLSKLNDLDGFILKSKSPSCGLKDVKLYESDHNKKSELGSGIFGQAVKDCFPDLPMEDEGRLTNSKIREHFYSAVFTLARFRSIKNNLIMNDLVEFHASHKFLFLAYNQKQMRILGRITANLEKRPLNEVFQDYYNNLVLVFKKPPRNSNILNVWMHIMGFFSDKISSAEKVHLLDLMQQYTDDLIPPSVITQILYSLTVRFDHPYLHKQLFFNPFPKELLTLHDSAKRRI